MKGSQGRRAPEVGAGLGGFARRTSGLLIPSGAITEHSEPKRIQTTQKSGLEVVRYEKPKSKDGPKTVRRKKEKARRKSRAKNR